MTNFLSQCVGTRMTCAGLVCLYLLWPKWFGLFTHAKVYFLRQWLKQPTKCTHDTIYVWCPWISCMCLGDVSFQMHICHSRTYMIQLMSNTIGNLWCHILSFHVCLRRIRLKWYVIGRCCFPYAHMRHKMPAGLGWFYHPLVDIYILICASYERCL